MRSMIGVVLALLVAPAVQAQQLAVVTRNALLHSGPSSSSGRIAALAVGDVVTLLGSGARSGYLRVRNQDEDAGWVAEHAVRVLDPAETHQPVASANGVEHAPDDLTVESNVFDSCPPEGNPIPAAIKALNRLKNRSAEPMPSDIDSSVTLAAMLAPATDDSHRFDAGRAAEIVGFVYDVIPGGRKETCNCGKGDPVHRDSHIELVLSPSDTAAIRRVIVEVTPRWRAAAKQRGIDWSTTSLQQLIEGHWVRVRGWLMFDAEHKGQAENTHPGGDKNWRATAWEIHPVANLTIVLGP